MREFLHFTLHGPLASWGEAAVGDLRPTNPHPTRSALLGMIAACLGIPRTAEQALLDLERRLGLAVRVDREGTLLRDYHTVQTPEGMRARDMATRREELAYKKVGASLTYREYRADAVYRVAVWERHDDVGPGLDAIADALERPRFVPYLGRKSCPLAHPFDPKRVEAANLFALFSGLELASVASDLGRGASSPVDVFWDGDDEGFSDIIATQPRYDVLTSRERWQFTRRDEHRARVELPRPQEA